MDRKRVPSARRPGRDALGYFALHVPENIWECMNKAGTNLDLAEVPIAAEMVSGGGAQPMKKRREIEVRAVGSSM